MDPYENDQEASPYGYRWLHWHDGRGRRSVPMDDGTILEMARCFGKWARERFSGHQGEYQVKTKAMLKGER